MTRIPGVILPLVGSLLLSPLSGASEDAPFAGTVRSSVGALLEGVEVLVVAKPAAPAPVAVAITDDQGRFRIVGLAPGVYQVAALKRGYASFVGQVDTRLERWIELILRPEAGLSEQRQSALPDHSSWALRLPRRQVLRETDAALLDASDNDESSEGALTVQVDQLFAAGSSLDSRRPEDPVMRGVETRIRLASGVGERGRIQLRGHRESLEAARNAGRVERDSAASDDAAGISLGFAYDTGVDGQLTVDAFYRHRDLSWSPAFPDPVAPLRQEQRSWGGRSGWEKQLDPVSRLAISLDYHDAAFRLPQEVDGGEAGSPSAMVNRSVEAAGSYGTVRSDDHRVQVDFQARLLDTSLPRQRLAAAGGRGSFGGVEGWTVGVQARDTWHLTGPFSLIYGLGYNHALRLADSSLIVPQLGGSWVLDDVSMSALVSYHAVTDWSGGADAWGHEPFKPAGELGYETRVELPLTETLRVTGSTRYTPIQFEFRGGDRTSWSGGSAPLYLTDGNAAVHRNRVALVRATRSTQAYAEIAQGRAEGTLAAVLPYEIPYQDLAERRLRYLNGRVGVRLVPAGTHLVIEYRQLEERPVSELGADLPTHQKSLELSLVQDLMRRRDLGNWRLLMGVRVASLETDAEGWLATGNETIAENLGGRLRAGLSVEF